MVELQRMNNSRIYHTNNVQQAFKAGDITKGKILKLYPHQKAAIQLGNQTMVAQLEAPLTNLKSYYFQVQHTSSDLVHLKVLHDTSHRVSSEDPRSLMQFLGLKISKPRLSLFNTLMTDEIPLDEEQLGKAFQLLDKTSDKNQAQPIIKEMILRKLPLTENIFNALSVHADRTFSSEIRNMMQLLNEIPETTTTKLLQHMFGKLLMKPQNILNPKEQFIQQMNQLSAMDIGRDKNTEDIQGETQTMKSLLVQMLQDNDGIIHDKAKHFLYFLNGLQLQSVHETANFLEARMQIPAENMRLNGDVFINFSGKKTKTGEINPDYCNIIFYLDLATIRETVIDMHVQKRAVTLTILNARQTALEQVSETLKDTLKEGLETLDYQLQAVRFKSYQPEKEQTFDEKSSAHSPSYQGVDYRI